jgi:hypothetical protein
MKVFIFWILPHKDFGNGSVQSKKKFRSYFSVDITPLTPPCAGNPYGTVIVPDDDPIMTQYASAFILVPGGLLPSENESVNPSSDV